MESDGLESESRSSYQDIMKKFGRRSFHGSKTSLPGSVAAPTTETVSGTAATTATTTTSPPSRPSSRRSSRKSGEYRPISQPTIPDEDFVVIDEIPTNLIGMAFDEVSSPALAYKFSSQEFDADKYVKDLVSKCDIKKELLEHRHNTQILSDETAVSMKKNVYRNYKQFIDTSKEISYLEAEMYQLSHMLTEQKALLTAQKEMNICGTTKKVKSGSFQEKPVKEEIKKGKRLYEIISGCKDLLNDTTTNDVVFEGELTEIDTDMYTPFQKIQAFLLGDKLVISTPSLTRSSATKYKFQKLFDLNDLAIVNVRDGAGVKNAFKILHGLETRMFGAQDKEKKNLWLDTFEKAKKNYRQKVESDTKSISPPPKNVSGMTSPEESDEDESSAEENKYPDLLNVDWLLELPDDLDMCIAQRDFEGAVKLVEKANTYLKDFPETPALKEYRDRLTLRIGQLVDSLEQSLDNSQIMRHVSARSIGQYVSLLIRLGRGKLACELFLKNKGYSIKHSFRQLKIEGSTAMYITKLANVFFSSVIETGKEFRKIFNKSSNASGFVVWAHRELQHFVSLFVRQVFSRNSSLAAIAVCINIAMDHCQKLYCIGLDLTFDMNHMFLKHLMESMFDNRDQLIEGAKHRGTEETWKPTDYSKNQDHLYNITCELESLGIEDIDGYITGNNVLILSNSTITFAKGVLTFFEDGLRLYSPQLHSVFVQCLTEIFKTQALQLEATMRSEQFTNEIKFIVKNCIFIFDCILLQIVKRLKEKVGHEVENLKEIHDELPRLQKIASLIKPR